MPFSNKNNTSINQDQLELIKNAQGRIKQKKRLFYHFVLFLAGCLILPFLNLALDYGKDVKPFGYDWYMGAIFIWGILLFAHAFDVFVTSRFMGKEWEQQQLHKLVGKQEERIAKLKANLLNEEQLMAESEIAQDKIAKKAIDTSSQETKQTVTIIAAAAENNALGKDNNLIWHLSDDLKHFKTLTNGHHIIMGRKTFESMPKALPNRVNVVISRQTDYAPENTIVVHSLGEALNVAKEDELPFIIGGGEIYKQAMDIADCIELTRVHHSFEADTFFPEIDTNVWKEVKSTLHEKDEKHEYDFTFIRYERI